MTATRNFGSSGRESHDATAFYDRFDRPDLSNDETVNEPGIVDRIICGDARDMALINSNSVALVVTSPPYFVGKEYEQNLDADGVPGSYGEYLEMLADVFGECWRVLEPGGRIAVNIANLGRKPYLSLSGDVSTMLRGVGFLLRGEIIWVKAKGAGGSCAWGSYMSPVNPVLRDVTERVVVASKGRFGRAIKPVDREKLGLPHIATISKDEFLRSTLDVWEIPPASATRVGHPAPFPVELPRRLIELYTFADDVVLDPFVGAGSTAVACVETGRRWLGFDTDASYVDLAERRIGEAIQTLEDIS